MEKNKNTDPNEDAARVVQSSTSKHEHALPPDVEDAWLIWSKGLRKVDERTMTLLKAAFEAGHTSGRASRASMK